MVEKLKYGEPGAELVDEAGRAGCGVKWVPGAFEGIDIGCNACIGVGDASGCG